MDRATIGVYDGHARTYLTNRGVGDPAAVRAFVRSLPADARRLDLGSGPGHYLDLLGPELAVAVDGSQPMLHESRARHPDVPAVQADLAALPFRRGAFGGVWANKCLQHVPAHELPMALADLHHVLPVGGRLDLLTFSGAGTWRSDDDLPGRAFTLWQPDALVDLVVGAGFGVDHLDHRPYTADEASTESSTWEAGTISMRATRHRTLPDFVGPSMRLLVCGLNPSLYAADAGVGFARPGNRFWPALRAAGIVGPDLDRDPRALLRRCRIGMTDLVKRATVAAVELTRDEYRSGLGRVERLCALLEPAAVCFVGLAGWRAAVDPKARAGWQPRALGATPVYVMPNTSGLNARTPLPAFADHLSAAISVGGDAPPTQEGPP